MQFDCTVKTYSNDIVDFNMSKGFEVMNQIRMTKEGISIIYPYLRKVYFPLEQETTRYELHPGTLLYGINDDEYPSVVLKGSDRETGKIQCSVSFLCNPEFKKMVEEYIKE